MQTNRTQIIDQVLRFPAKPQGWADIEDYIYLPMPKPHVAEEISEALAQSQVTLRQIGEVLQASGHAHETAANAIQPEAWRLLFYRGVFSAPSLLMPKFHAELALRSLCASKDSFDDPPLEWLGTEKSAQEIAEELELTLRYLGAAPCVMVWLVLAVAQRVDLSTSEVVQCTWWDPRWLRSFTERVLLVS